MLGETVTDRVLLDCQVGTEKGGTGQSFDWSLLDDVTDKKKLIVAGGIHAGNLVAALGTGAGTIDVNSGVEDAPAQKSAEKLAALFATARRY